MTTARSVERLGVTWWADAGPSVGLGHVMRGVPVAEECRRRSVPCDLVVVGAPVPSVDLAAFTTTRSAGPPSVERPDSRRIAVFDGYSFEPSDFAAVTDEGCTVAVLEDHGHGTFPVDVLVDTDSPVPRDQQVRADTTRLNGPSFALVRSEFLQRRRERPLASGRRSVAVTFGGSDVARVAPRVADELTALDVDLSVVAGPYSVAADWPSRAAVVVAPEELAAVMDGADVVVSAAGNTAFEVAAMGLPSVLLPVAANQDQLAALLSDAGAARVVHEPSEVVAAVRDLLQPAVHEAVANAALALVDGRGAARLLDALDVASTAAKRQ